MPRLPELLQAGELPPLPLQALQAAHDIAVAIAKQQIAL